ncbi:MAG: ABC transporter permease subunit [Pseudonocardiaceae bacterium]|nr:ABC transporter permease subunit [Pseudonocardiaceae bacterium]
MSGQPDTVGEQRPLFEWDWVGRNMDRIGERVVEHLELTGVAVASGVLIALALAMVSLRWRRLHAVILGIGGVLYAIPALAAFAFLVPIFGLSFPTAVIPLISYTILILVRNIVTGIDQVPGDVREAARGMGFTRARVFRKVELPLAVPVIVAGTRISAVTTIGLVTVTSILGVGGLGAFILQGFRTLPIYPTPIVVGVVASVLLAILVDLALLLTERALTPWARRGSA